MTADAQALKAALQMKLMQYVDAKEQQESEEKVNREQRWAHILERQQSALLQQEQAVKAEEKELSKLEREEQWQKSQTVRTEQKVEDSACAGQQTTVRALITASQDQQHVSCLKGQ